MKKQERLGVHAERVMKNVDNLWAELPALRWMGGQAHPPKQRNQMVLEGGAKLGRFWAHCKSAKRCAYPHYDRLLTNPVLRADYRNTTSDTSEQYRLLNLQRRRFRSHGPSLRSSVDGGENRSTYAARLGTAARWRQARALLAQLQVA